MNKKTDSEIGNYFYDERQETLKHKPFKHDIEEVWCSIVVIIWFVLLLVGTIGYLYE